MVDPLRCQDVQELWQGAAGAHDAEAGQEDVPHGQEATHLEPAGQARGEEVTRKEGGSRAKQPSLAHLGLEAM